MAKIYIPKELVKTKHLKVIVVIGIVFLYPSTSSVNGALLEIMHDDSGYYVSLPGNHSNATIKSVYDGCADVLIATLPENYYNT